jgi:hypothetical protein
VNRGQEFSRKAQQDRFAEIRGPRARAAFRELLDVLAAHDAVSFGTVEDTFATRCFDWVDEMLSEQGPLEGLRVYFEFGLEAPAEYRRKISPRLDFTGCVSYGDVAKRLCQAVHDTGLARLGKQAVGKYRK